MKRYSPPMSSLTGFMMLSVMLVLLTPQGAVAQSEAGMTVGHAVMAQRGAPAKPSPSEWRGYWEQGKAELTSYSLKQARYGALHDGHAVLVFVTEPFSRTKQVKLDYAAGAGGDAVPVLKLNHTRKFNTGIYPYSTMRSVFTPTTGEPTIKVTTSLQEWCGHVFMQLNRRGDVYQGQAFSYFESEGDRTLSLPAGVLLEDDVWTLARIDPTRLPTGNVSMLPSTVFLRLLHVPFAPQRAEASLASNAEGWLYTVRYPDMGRTVSIQLEKAFPYRIAGWKEAVQSGFGPGRKPLTTVATRKSTLMTAYWRQNAPEDRALRQKLGLPR